MTTAAPEKDPLEVFESVPAVSFHEPNGGHAKGEWARLKVVDWPKLLEQKDDEGNIERWDNGDAKLVLVAAVEEDGEKKSLWAKKTGKKAVGSLYQQLAAAQKKVRADTGDESYRLGPGDTLAVQYVGDDKSVAPKKGNYPKIFKVVIKPGARPATNADPFADEPPAAKDESPWGNDGDGNSGLDAPTPHPAPTQVGGDPFGPADADDEPPF